MASKRQLYQPAPKARAGERKGRKPLVQGRLIAMATTESTGTDAGTGTIRQSAEKRQSPRLTQGLPNCNPVPMYRYQSRDGDSLDPSITPRKSIPALTELMSPQPEPPSRVLDLSDADLGINGQSEVNKQQSIMVCDASYLANSPDHTEVEVVVNFENSPACVVCHTPGRLERSLHSSATSKHCVVVESPKSVGLIPTKLFPDSHPPGGDSAEPEETKPLISQHSQGLIKEILAEEIGAEHVDAISLYSHNSSSPQHPSLSPPKHQSHRTSNRYPRNSSPIDDQDKHIISASLNNEDSTKSPTPSKLSLPQQHKLLSTNDEISVPSEPSGQMRGTKYKKEARMREGTDDSDSDILSLYEYVTPKAHGQVKNKSKTDTAESSSIPHESSGSSLAKSVKNVKPKRVVSSRYRQAANKVSTTSLVKDSSSDNSTSKSFAKPKLQVKSENVKVKVQNKRHISNKQAFSKYIASQTSTSNLSEQTFPRMFSPHTAVQDHSDSGREPGTVRQTSTPTHDCSALPSYMDASSIQSVSALLVDSSMNFSKLSEHLDSKSTKQKTAPVKAHIDQVNITKNLPLHLDIEYSRYLQACFFNSKAKKLHREQDKRSLKDLNSLWNLVEKQRQEVSEAERDLERLKQIHQLENFLDKTDSEMAALIPKLPQVEGDYIKLCQALDTTRHQIATKDILLPSGDEDIREAYEDKLESVLKESEMLLNEINKVVDVRARPLTQYQTGLEVVNQNVGAIGVQLREGQTDLEEAQGLCTRLASLTSLDLDHRLT